MSAIRSETLRTALLPIPPTPEQARIEQRLTTFQSRLDSEAAYAAKLRTLKKGLMHDLLTGRVRVHTGATHE